MAIDKSLKTLLLSLVCLTIIFAIVTSQTDSDKTFPDMLKIVDRGYRARVEKTTRAAEMGINTYFMDEYHDLDGRRGRLDNTGLRGEFYYYSNLKQIVSIDSSNECEVLKMGDDELSWGFLDTNLRIIGDSALLFRKTTPPVFAGQVLVRGIVCNRFTANDAVEDNSVEIDYYFAASNWTSASGVKFINPIRIVCKGTVGLRSNFTSNIDFFTDFISFTPNITSELKFSIPSGIGCKGFKVPTDHTYPTVESQFSFFAEIFDVENFENSIETTVLSNKVWFDGDNNLIRVDVSMGDTPYTVIQDFQTGVSYEIDHHTNVCSMKPIVNSGAETAIGSVVGAMKTPREFMQLDGDFYYIGKEFSRTIYCDIWETVKYNISVNNITYDKTVFTYYFMSSDFEAISEGDTNLNIPVSLTITGYNEIDVNKKSLKMVYNFFKFDEADNGKLPYEEINIGNCFPNESDKTYFTITFDSNETLTSVAKEKSREFEKKALLSIAEYASVSLIRFPERKIYYEPNRIVLLGVLLNRPPVAAGFYLTRSNITPTAEMSLRKVVQSGIEECATICSEEKPFCLGFALCDKQCYVSKVATVGESKTGSGLANCEFYTRAVKESNVHDVPLSDAINNLKASVQSKRMLVSLPGVSSELVYTAQSFAFGLKPFSKSQHGILFETVMTKRQLDLQSDTIAITSPSLSVDDCYWSCISEPKISCTGFSYCSNTRSCRLSSVQFLESDFKSNNNTEISATQCNVYKLLAMSIFEKTPGLVPEGKGDKRLKEIANVEQCASSCKYEKDFKCRGFEYCDSFKVCVMHKSHYLDEVPMENEDFMCAHYSLKYSVEYTNSGHINIKDPKSITMLELSFEGCARQCSEILIDFDCRSINYWPNDETCVVNTVSIRDENVQFETNENVTHYIRDSTRNLKVFPNILNMTRKSFQVHSIIRNRGFEFSMQEFHDPQQRKGRITEISNNVEKTIFYFLETEQTVAVTKDGCSVNHLKKPDTNAWAMVARNGNLIGASSIFSRETEALPVFIGVEIIRGIKCNKFEAKDKIDKNVTITYYFNNEKWAFGSNKTVPIKMVVTGNYEFLGAIQKVDIEIDFVNFMAIPVQDILETFKIPRGLGCSGLINPPGMVMAELEEEYSFYMEQYSKSDGENHLESAIEIRKVIYDGSQKMVQLEYVDDNRKFVKEIQDFKTGVSYYFPNPEACVMKPITLPNGLKSGGTPGIVQGMKDANEFLDFKGDFYYLGNEFSRSMLCDVWEKVEEDVGFGDAKMHKVVYTFYLMSLQVESVVDGNVNMQVPIQINLNMYKTEKNEPIQYQFNVFDFNEAYGRLFREEIDVEKCFTTPIDHNYFKIYFNSTLKSSLLAESSRNTFEIQLLLDIYNKVQISSLRMPELRVYYEPNYISAMGLLLDRPPVLAGFIKYEKDIAALRLEKQITEVKNIEECAVYCLDEISFNCLGFTICEEVDHKSCFLTRNDISGVQADVKPDELNNCNLYFRSVNTSYKDPSLEKVLRSLNDNVKMGIPQIQILDANEDENEDETKTKSITFIPTRLEINLNPFDWNEKEVPYETVYTKFEFIDPKNSFTIFDIGANLDSVEKCYQQCVKDDRLACASFSFCETGHRCRLSSSYMEIGEDSESLKEVSPATSCNVYRKSEIQFFEKDPGIVPQSNSKVIYKNVKSEKECAVSCKHEQSFSCKGFEFCERSQTCIPRDTHLLDSIVIVNKVNETDGSCTHFSRKYSSEFISLGFKSLYDPNHVTMQGISFEQCAKYCYEKETTRDCNSINYCPESLGKVAICEFNVLAAQDENPKFNTSTECLHYSKNYNPPPPFDPIFPNAKDYLSKGYSTQVEVTKNRMGYTQSLIFDEFHDVLGGRGRFDRVGFESSYFYFSDIQQVLIIESNWCRALPFTSTSFINQTTDWELLDNENLIVGPSSLLWRETKEKPQYFGRTFIRGIPVNKWIADDKKDNVKIEYYITAKSWISTDATRQGTPVAVIAKGTYGNNQPVDLRIDFTFFEALSPKSVRFMVPKGIGCKGFKTSERRSMPKVNNQLSFVEESHIKNSEDEHLTSVVGLHRIYFDGFAKILRLDGPDENDKHTVSIQDFSTGVEYLSDLNNNCFFKPIKFSWADESSPGVVDSMVNGSELLGFNGEYYYLGTEVKRGINCDVWETVKENVDMFGIKAERLVETVFFMAPDLISNAGGHKSTQTPLSISLYVQQNRTSDAVEYIFNVFDFDDEEGRLFYDLFNIENCYSGDLKEQFVITFPSTPAFTKYNENDIKNFQAEALFTISAAADVTILRIPNVKIFFSPSDITIFGTLLEKLPSIDGFYIHSNIKPFTSQLTKGPIKDSNDCANFCLGEKTFSCKGFTVCKNKDIPECFISALDYNDAGWGDYLEEYDNCELHIKSDSNFNSTEISLKEALKNLQDSIDNKLLTLGLGQNMSVAAYKFIHKKVLVNIEDEKLFDTAYTGFMLDSDSQTTHEITNTGIFTVSECYEQCLRETTISCASFSYCKNNGNCRISSIYLDTRKNSSKDEIKESNSCNTYNKEALQFFEETPGLVPKRFNKKSLSGITGNRPCAVYCQNELDFQCKGFEFCEETQSCLLHDSHMLEKSLVPSKNLGCKHYSKKYGSEFSNYGRMRLIEPNSMTTINYISFEHCAKLCIDKTYGVNCNSIDYCVGEETDPSTVTTSKSVIDNTPSCILHNVSYKDESAQLVPSNVCQHYSLFSSDIKPPVVQIPFPDLKTILANEFVVHSELTNLQTKGSLFIEEYHDVKNSRGLLNIISAMNHPKFYYFSDSQQVVSIEGDSCSVNEYSKLHDIMDSISWGWRNPSDWGSVMGPSSVLFREFLEVPIYIGTENVRGMLCDKFTARDKLEDIAIEYYFTAAEWNSSDLIKSIPIRIKAFGSYTYLETELELDIEIDFTYFRTGTVQPEAFMVPRGVGCLGLKTVNKKTIPKVGEQFFLSGEMYHPTDSENKVETTVTLFKTWFDGVNKLVKIESQTLQHRPMSEIQDLKSGVSYVFRPSEGNSKECEYGPIVQSLAKTSIAGSVGPMTTAAQYLGLDSQYYYLGNEFVRGIKCDIWESVKENYIYYGNKYDRIVQTVNFMSLDYESVTIGGDVNTQVPLSISTKFINKESTYRIEYHNFDFNEKVKYTIHDEMNIQTCFEDKEQLDHFMIHFVSNNASNKVTTEEEEQFRVKATLKIADAAQVSVIRIKVLQISYEPKRISVLGLMTGKPPFSTGFYTYNATKTEFPRKDDNIIISFSDPEKCAKACLENVDPLCKSFRMCRESTASAQECVLSFSDASNTGNEMKSNFIKCQHYIRSDTELNSNLDQPLDQARMNLEQAAVNGKIIIELTGKQKATVISEGSEDRLKPRNFEDDNFEIVSEKSQLDKVSETTTEFGQVDSLSSCNEACIKEITLSCSSFSYCEVTNKCRLSSVYLDPKNTHFKDEIEEDATQCTVYRKTAMSLFTAYPGMIVEGTVGKTAKKADVADQCALMCKESKGTKCYGFEYCSHTRDCILHDKHMFDLPPSTTSSEVCTYYAAKFSVEFADMGRMILNDPDSITQNGVSFEECAKLCIEEMTTTCRSINYCPIQRKCMLNTKADGDDGVRLDGSTECFHYFKVDKQAPLKPKERVQIQEESGISSRSFTGTAFSLFFVGLILGIVGYFIGAWYKRERMNPANVRYVTQE